MARWKLEALNGDAASHLLLAVMVLRASGPWPAQGSRGSPHHWDPRWYCSVNKWDYRAQADR